MEEAVWQWSAVTEHLPALGQAAIVTILLSGITIVIGTGLGVLLGSTEASRSAPIRGLGWILMLPCRIAGVLPALVLLLWLHLAIPGSTAWLQAILEAIATTLEPNAGDVETNVLQGMASRPFATAAFGLTIVLTASVAGIVRRALRDIPVELIDAAKSQGMSAGMRLRRVVAPEALRTGLVPLINSYISLVRLTTLAAFIGCQELVFVAIATGTESSRERELVTALAIAYLLVLVPATLLAGYLERSRWIQRA